MLQKESVDRAVLSLLYALQEKEYLKNFFLVGGTGLALMIGHRKSIDIDLFTTRDFDTEILLEKLESDFDFRMDFIEKNTIKGYADGVKVDFLAHKYPMINKRLEIEDLRIASLDDISAMKVNSIANDGTRVKDFIDLFFLVSEHDYKIEKLLNNYEAKYTQRNAMHALKCDPELAIELREQHSEVTPAWHFNKIIIPFYYTVEGAANRNSSAFTTYCPPTELVKSLVCP